MDQLLARGPLLSPPNSETTGRPGAPDPWASVSPVLDAADPALVADHLAWLVSPPHGGGDPTQSSQVEDQIRILVRALDERHEHDLLVGALDQTPPWAAEAVIDDDETIIGYATNLTTVTDGYPEDSPYVALATCADQWASGILDHRGSSLAHQPRA